MPSSYTPGEPTSSPLTPSKYEGEPGWAAPMQHPAREGMAAFGDNRSGHDGVCPCHRQRIRLRDRRRTAARSRWGNCWQADPVTRAIRGRPDCPSRRESCLRLALLLDPGDQAGGGDPQRVAEAEDHVEG